MPGRFTERAQRIVLIAQEEAKRLNHDFVGTEHILLGLIALGEGVAAQVLANLGADLRRCRQEVEKIVGTGESLMMLGEIPFTPRAKKVLEYATEEAQTLGHSYIGTEHLLLGLIREEGGVAAKVLEAMNFRLEVVREEVLNVISDEPKPPKPKPSNKRLYPVKTYCATVSVVFKDCRADRDAQRALVNVLSKIGDCQRVSSAATLTFKKRQIVEEDLIA